jgi:hypothetical protein
MNYLNRPPLGPKTMETIRRNNSETYANVQKDYKTCMEHFALIKKWYKYVSGHRWKIDQRLKELDSSIQFFDRLVDNKGQSLSAISRGALYLFPGTRRQSSADEVSSLPTVVEGSQPSQPSDKRQSSADELLSPLLSIAEDPQSLQMEELEDDFVGIEACSESEDEEDCSSGQSASNVGDSVVAAVSQEAEVLPQASSESSSPDLAAKVPPSNVPMATVVNQASSHVPAAASEMSRVLTVAANIPVEEAACPKPDVSDLAAAKNQGSSRRKVSPPKHSGAVSRKPVPPAQAGSVSEAAAREQGGQKKSGGSFDEFIQSLVPDRSSAAVVKGPKANFMSDSQSPPLPPRSSESSFAAVAGRPAARGRG